ncbi:MAG TPA: hypothetical protein VFA59_15495 [Vicinamibacterales bacterium]|nr:hypothetical protein [Vicinamibacterales bacterium]
MSARQGQRGAPGSSQLRLQLQFQLQVQVQVQVQVQFQFQLLWPVRQASMAGQPLDAVQQRLAPPPASSFDERYSTR